MKIKFLSILLAAVIAANVTAYAETINTEDGKKIEFCLEDSLPQNLAVDVDTDSNIKLIFNKNVVNFSVKENNLKCISLKNEDGQVVPSELIFPDDQIEPDKKREIYIDPVENLNEKTTYTVEISSDMLAKNGSTLGETVYVSFTTISSVAQEVPETKNTEQPLQPTTEVSNTPQQTETTEESTIGTQDEESPVKENAISEESITEEVLETNVPEVDKQSGEENSSSNEENDADENSKDFGLIYAVIVLVLATSAFIVYKKIKKR
jgi:hypothetical protein